MDFDIEKYRKDANHEFKVVYDVFCAYFLNLLEGKKREQYISTLTKEQTLQTVNWIQDHIIPFYESVEDYERCARLKVVREWIIKEKGLE